MPDFDKELAKQNGMSDAAIEAADSIKKNQQEGQIKYPYNKEVVCYYIISMKMLWKKKI